MRKAVFISDIPSSVFANMIPMKNVIFVGYEAYSATLLLQAYHWSAKLFKKAKVRICILMAASHEDRALSEIWSTPKRDDELPFNAKETAVISIIPVGSTMSTVYKVREIVGRHYLQAGAKLGDTMANYCILATNSCLFKNKTEWDAATKNYWKDCDTQTKTITVQPNYSEGHGLSVKYLLPAHSKWQTQRGVQLYMKEPVENDQGDSTALFPSNEKYAPIWPILQVDKTSTLLESIFTLRDRHYKPLDNTPPHEMNKRFAYLYGHISYAHIYEKHNHYQFYVDNGGLFRQAQKQVKNWLESIKIDHSSFNVIVSPLDKSNVSFVKCVIDNVFASSIRYIHIDINNSFQEDFRRKYSFLAEEYDKFKRRMPSAKFNIYFVDEAIVSTRTIARSELLMRMLLKESNADVHTEHIFSKIFLLVNHSSYDTLNNYVAHPEQNVHAWINLNIPSYNTQADRCPACDLVDSYVLLRKRSSTQSIGHVFDYLVDKHKKRTKEEYDAWQRKAILSQHAYFVWTKQWLLFDVNVSRGAVKIWLPANVKYEPTERECLVIHALEDLIRAQSKTIYKDAFAPELSQERREQQQAYLKKQGEITFQKLLQEDAPSQRITEDDIVDLVRKYVIAKRDYMRLYCLHKAYTRLIYNGGCSSPGIDEDVAVREIILQMMCEELKHDDDGWPQDMSAYSINAEWLISYIKILSRPHLARHYHIQVAIINVMMDMLRIMMSSAKGEYSELQRQADRLTKENENWKNIIRTLRCGEKVRHEDSTPVRTANNNLCAALQYEIIMTLAHRLSVIQCDVACREDTLRAAFAGYGHLVDKYFGEGEYSYINDADRLLMLQFTEIPSTGDVFRRYVKSVKAATMITNNDDPCYKLAEMVLSMINEGKAR